MAAGRARTVCGSWTLAQLQDVLLLQLGDATMLDRDRAQSPPPRRVGPCANAVGTVGMRFLQPPSSRANPLARRVRGSSTPAQLVAGQYDAAGFHRMRIATQDLELRALTLAPEAYVEFVLPQAEIEQRYIG